jgi:DNA-binding beta-propeller fold protein YncE
MTISAQQIRSIAAACMFSAILSATAAADTGYRLTARWPTGGAEKWDYLIVDSTQHRLFVSRATHVQVLDLESGKIVGDIANTPGVHGIALAPDLNRGFTSNGKADSVTVFNLQTLATIAVIKISGHGPDAIIYDASSRRIYAFNGHSDSATVIDAGAAKEIGSIALPGRPEFAVSDGAGRIFVNLEDKAQVAVIDVAKGSVTSTWPLAPCEEPTGLALDAARKRLFSVCHNERLIVTDSATGARVAELPIGKHVDAAAFDAQTLLVFSSNGDSADVTVVAAGPGDRYAVKGSLATAKGAKTMALDAATHRIYVPAIGASGFEIMVAAPN